MIRPTATALLLVCAACTAQAPKNDTAVNAAEPANAVQAALPAAPINDTAPAVNEAAPAAADAKGLPADVTAFIERRDGCEHWAGEPDWGDAERNKQIDAAVKDLCPGIDTALAEMRKRYAGNPRVIAALHDYEPLGMED